MKYSHLTSDQGKMLLFAAFLSLFIVFYHTYGFMGPYGYDDISYSRIAATMSHGDFKITDDPDTYRWGIVIPTAISYWLFGVDDQSAAIPPILVSIATLWLVLFLCFRQRPGIAIIAMSVYCLNPWTIFYSDKTMPDVYITLSVIGAIAVLYHHKFISVRKPAILHGALFSAMIFMGFVTKVTILLLLPAFMVLFFSDVLQRKDRKFWLCTIAVTLLMATTYFFYVKYETGSFFTRFSAIRESSFFRVHGFEHKRNWDMFVRLTYGLFDLFVQQSMLVGLVFSIPVLFSLRKVNLIRMEEKNFLTLSLALLFLSAFFMSTSPDQYIPLPIDHRHFLFLIPIAAIVGAPVVFEFFMYKKRIMWVLGGILILALVSVLKDYGSWKSVYVPLLALVGSRMLFRSFDKPSRGYVFLGLFIAILFIQPLENMAFARASGYSIQKKLILEQFKGNAEKNLVITNPVQKHLGQYYMGFDPYNNTKFISYEEAKSYSFTPGEHIYLLLNDFSRALSGISNLDLPPYSQMPGGTFQQLFREEGIQLYAIDNPQALKQIEEHSIHTAFNDFERDNTGWHIEQENIQSAVKYSGNKANRVKSRKYSATFSKKLLDIGLNERGKDYVASSVMISVQGHSGSLLIVEIKEEGHPTFWESAGKKKFDKIEGDWMKIRIKSEIPKHFGPNAKVSVYVWNSGDEEIFIDDLGIEITTLVNSGSKP